MLLSYCVTEHLVFCVLFISLKVQGHGRKLLSLSPHHRKQLRYKEVTQLPLNPFPRSSLKWTSLELALLQDSQCFGMYLKRFGCVQKTNSLLSVP